MQGRIDQSGYRSRTGRARRRSCLGCCPCDARRFAAPGLAMTADTGRADLLAGVVAQLAVFTAPFLGPSCTRRSSSGGRTGRASPSCHAAGWLNDFSWFGRSSVSAKTSRTLAKPWPPYATPRLRPNCPPAAYVRGRSIAPQPVTSGKRPLLVSLNGPSPATHGNGKLRREPSLGLMLCWPSAVLGTEIQERVYAVFLMSSTTAVLTWVGCGSGHGVLR